MATRAEVVKSKSQKKGLDAKHARKNAQRKEKGEQREAAPTAKDKETGRLKRDSALVITAEQEFSSPAARARRDQVKESRVRGSATH